MSVANVKNIEVYVYEELLNDLLRNRLIAKDKKFFVLFNVDIKSDRCNCDKFKRLISNIECQSETIYKYKYDEV